MNVLCTFNLRPLSTGLVKYHKAKFNLLVYRCDRPYFSKRKKIFLKMLAYSEYWLNNLYMTGVKFKPVSRIGENAGEKLIA